MNEVLQKLFFVLIAISFFHSGCVTTPTTNETNQFTEPNKRVSFPNEGFSIERPPDDWVMMKPKPVELARWQQRVTSSAILIGATINPQLNLSKSAWAKLSINVTKIQLEDFSEYCEVINAKEEEIVFKGQEFYQISAVIKCTDFRGDMGKVLAKYSGPPKWDNGLRCVSQKKEAQIGQEKT